jgi:hypothetical protein
MKIKIGKQNRNKKYYKKTYKIQKGGTKKQPTCSPAANNDSIKKGATCFTPEILLKIKSEFNKDYPKNPIKTNEVREIWQQLHDRLTGTKCRGKTESCWLDIIDDKNMRDVIKQHIFAPKQPGEWKKNPDEWLSNFDIFNVIKQYEDVDEYADFKSISPTSIDFDSNRTGTQKCVSEDLCKFSLYNWLQKGKKRFGIVFNLDKHTGPGSHWVTLYVDTVNSFMFFFDSAGDDIPSEVKKLMDRIEIQGNKMNPKITFEKYDNSGHDHQKGNTECGMYSLFFMITMLTGKIPSNPNRVMSVEERIQLFLNKKIPDKVVFDYRDLYFNPDL